MWEEMGGKKHVRREFLPWESDGGMEEAVTEENMLEEKPNELVIEN